VAVLAAAQALSLAGAPIVILTGGLIGEALAPTPALATLPIASMVVGNASASIPAALLMERVGRRAGFAVGASLAAVAALLAALAIARESWVGFALATFLLGANSSFAQQFRFAAMESVPASAAGRAVSGVLVAGVVGGVAGPELARATRGALPAEWAGSFLALAGVYAVALALLLLLFRDPAPPERRSHAVGRRTLAAIASAPSYRVALLAGALAYGVMSLVMTATPVSMHRVDGHSLEATSRVIQAHLAAMFLPSLVTGSLVGRWGSRRVLVLGALTLAAALLVDASGHGVPHYGVGLVLLGLGWNLLWVAATVQLGASYAPEDRFRAQALNDFTVFAVQGAASVSAGALVHGVGWRTLNLLPLPLLALLLLAAARVRPGRAEATPA